MAILRFCARIIATPIFAVSFGFMWLGFICFIGPMFQMFSFLEGERFNWKEHIAECNECFCEPFTSIWKSVSAEGGK
jgi:hypothetical protein